jgi:ABC-type uncharacterized transport system involved in gliding motility auxiliary subunit
MAGPTTEPFPQELDKLDAYLNAGGSALLMLDPPPAASLKDFTKKWAVNVGDNRVIDVTGVGRFLGKGPIRLWSRPTASIKFWIVSA